VLAEVTALGTNSRVLKAGDFWLLRAQDGPQYSCRSLPGMVYKVFLSIVVFLLVSTPAALSQASGKTNPLFGTSLGGINETGPHGFSFVTLVAPGASLTQPLGISNSGVVVGAYTKVSNNGFVLRNGNFATVNVPNSSTAVYGINSSAKLVGYYDADNGGASSQGFVFGNGKLETLNLPGAVATEASGINDASMVVGFGFVANVGSYEGFLYNGGVFTTLNFPGAAGTLARGINNHGQIVGSYYNNVPNDYSFLYSDGAFRELAVPGCSQSAAFGINNHGDVVGMCENTDGAISFLYKDGAFSFLEFPGATNTQAFGINDDDEIVGYYTTPGTADIYGFLATPTN
jgi:probable HAF family extracellular repeat protein